MAIVSRFVQLEKALLPIVVTLSGMDMLVKPVQRPNAELPIVVTLLGIILLGRLFKLLLL